MATLIEELAAPLRAGGFLADSQRDRLLAVLPRATGADLAAFAEAACAIRRARIGKAASLCAIVNAKSGRCGENCAFCAQSGHHATTAPEYPFLEPERIVAAAADMGAFSVSP